MPIYNWSQTAATNATADPTINWAEGQAPSTVNDSGRSMMVATAKWRDDISASITTGGTATAYTVTSNSVFDSLAHLAGQLIAFIPHVTNTSDTQTTLAVDGLAAKPIRFAPGVEIESGFLVHGAPYLCSYNNVDGAFYLIGSQNAPTSAGKFHVQMSANFGITPSTDTLVPFTTKLIDPDNLFNTGGGIYTYTPVLPGYYFLMLQVAMDGFNCRAEIYKNGALLASGSSVTVTSGITNTISTAHYLIKSTNGVDTFQGFAHTGNSSNILGATDLTFFMGWRISP